MKLTELVLNDTVSCFHEIFSSESKFIAFPLCASVLGLNSDTHITQFGIKWALISSFVLHNVEIQEFSTTVWKTNNSLKRVIVK